MTLIRSTLSNNTAEAGPSTFSPGFGGGIYIVSGTTTLKNSTISGNTAQGTATQGSDGRGGGIYVDSGALPLATPAPATARPPPISTRTKNMPPDVQKYAT